MLEQAVIDYQKGPKSLSHIFSTLSGILSFVRNDYPFSNLDTLLLLKDCSGISKNG
jgi:hypothetical protein